MVQPLGSTPRILFADDVASAAMATTAGSNGHGVTRWPEVLGTCPVCGAFHYYQTKGELLSCGPTGFVGTLGDLAELQAEHEGKAIDARLTPPPPPLEFYSLAEMAARIAGRGPRRFLYRGIFGAHDYAVEGGEAKSQKSWDAADAMVSTAAGAPLFGRYAADTTGPVLGFCGEGGDASILRRVRATAEAKGIADVLALPITICARAPKLSDPAHLALFADMVRALSPALVVMDPWYLSAGGLNSASLYEMGGALEKPQHMCADAGAALLVVTHYNRKEGRGHGRITGAGPAEWARVLITAEVIATTVDSATRETDVVRELSIVGGEIPDTTLRVRRRIRSDSPDDLDAPLHVEVTVEDGEAPARAAGGALSPAAAKLLEALAACGTSQSGELVDWIKQRHGHGLKRETVSRTLNDLERRGRVTSGGGDGPYGRKTWSLCEQA